MNTNNNIEILGVKISLESRDESLDTIKQFVQERRQAVVYFVNAHCLNLACTAPGYREVLNGADILLNDGTGIAWAARRQGKPFVDNCVGTDFIPALCDRGRDKDISYFLLGGTEGVAQKAADNWSKAYPGLNIAGVHHGYIDDDAEAEKDVIRQINESQADVLLVAMGMPLQERWIQCYKEQLNVGVIFAVGALLDYSAEVVPRAPQWMLDRGLEWVYRLWVEPKRLWKRYVIGNPMFMLRVLMSGNKKRGVGC
jgi:exopolysaccharide biosynthesis WecB/TagA/CpsF family protein